MLVDSKQKIAHLLALFVHQHLFISPLLFVSPEIAWKLPIDCILEQEYREILLQIYFTGGFGSLKYYTHLNIVFQPDL